MINNKFELKGYAIVGGKVGVLNKGSEPKKSYYKGGVRVKRNYKNKEGKYDYDSIFYTAFGYTAENLGKFVNKGDMICIEGNIRVAPASVGPDGTTYKERVDFIVTDFQTLGSPSGSSEATTTTESAIPKASSFNPFLEG